MTPYKRDWLGREMPPERPAQTAMEAAQEYLDFYDVSGRMVDKIFAVSPLRLRNWGVEILCTDGTTVNVDDRFIDHMRTAIANDFKDTMKIVTEIDRQKKMDSLP